MKTISHLALLCLSVALLPAQGQADEVCGGVNSVTTWGIVKDPAGANVPNLRGALTVQAVNQNGMVVSHTLVVVTDELGQLHDESGKPLNFDFLESGKPKEFRAFLSFSTPKVGPWDSLLKAHVPFWGPNIHTDLPAICDWKANLEFTLRQNQPPSAKAGAAIAMMNPGAAVPKTLDHAGLTQDAGTGYATTPKAAAAAPASSASQPATAVAAAPVAP